MSFCAHAIAREELLVVLDATLDPCFSDNPLVTGEPFIRFYAGVPLISPSGHAIGTLCIVDTTPHSAFDETARRQLRDLASMVLDKLELRRLELARQAGQARFENISAASPDGIVCVDQDGVISFWNSAAERLFGHSADDAIGRSVDLIMPEWVHSRRSDGMHEVASVALSHLVGRTVELEALHRGGTEFPIELSLSMWHENGVASFGAIIRDISERRANEERLFKLAHHDPLTELPNRAVLRSRIDQLARGTGRASVLILDLDGFKDVNDGFGSSAGDIVLKQVAKRLLGCVRATDIVARLGGDEFALLLLGVGDYRHACTIADSAIQAIASRLSWMARQLPWVPASALPSTLVIVPARMICCRTPTWHYTRPKQKGGSVIASLRPRCVRPPIAPARTRMSCDVVTSGKSSRYSTNLRFAFRTAPWSARRRC